MKLALTLLMTAFIAVSNGQSDNSLRSSDPQSHISLSFRHQDFADRLSVHFASDDQYDYYAIDLIKIGEEFERVYFMNLSYKEPRIVNLDGDLEKDETFFKSYYTNTEDEIICLFNDLKEKTDQASKNMTTEEKEAWMKKYNKFNKGVEK